MTQDDLIKQDSVENVVRKLGLTPTVDVCAAYREGFERALRRVGCMDGTVKMLLNEEQK